MLETVIPRETARASRRDQKAGADTKKPPQTAGARRGRPAHAADTTPPAANGLRPPRTARARRKHHAHAANTTAHAANSTAPAADEERPESPRPGRAGRTTKIDRSLRDAFRLAMLRTMSRTKTPKRAGAKKVSAKKAAAKKAVPKKNAPAEKPAAKKAAAKRAAPKKAAERTAKSAAKGAAKSALDPSRAWSLEELQAHLPNVDPAVVAQVRESIVRAQGEDGLLALGTSFVTDDILAAVPGFTVGALLALQGRKTTIAGLAPALLPLLVRETRELARVNTAFEQQLRRVSSAISGRRAQLKRANSEALVARRAVVRVLLQSVLPHDAPARAVLERAAGRARTPAATVASVRTVAEELATLRRDAAYTALLDSYGYGDDHVTYLNELADALERLATQGAGLTPPQETDQRALDLQDGLVLAILRAIWQPLRDARASGQSLPLPPLGALERMFVRSEPSGGDEELSEEDGAEPAASPAAPAQP